VPPLDRAITDLAGLWSRQRQDEAVVAILAGLCFESNPRIIVAALEALIEASPDEARMVMLSDELKRHLRLLESEDLDTSEALGRSYERGAEFAPALKPEPWRYASNPGYVISDIQTESRESPLLAVCIEFARLPEEAERFGQSREAAVQQLGRIGHYSAVPYLIDIAEDETGSDDLRAAAIRSIGQIGFWPALETVKRLAKPSRPELAVCLEFALQQLDSAEKTGELVVRNLYSSEHLARGGQYVCERIAKLASTGFVGGVPALINKLQYPDGSVRAAAARGLGVLGHSAAALKLLALAASPAEPRPLREAAAHAVGTTGDKSMAPNVVRLLGDPDEAVRAAAAKTLGNLRSEEVLPKVAKLVARGAVKFESPDNESLIAKAMSKIGCTVSVKALRPALEEGDDVKLNVVKALGYIIGRDSVLTLVALLRHEDEAIRKEAIRSLANQISYA